MNDLESLACTPLPLNLNGFNPNALIPYGCTFQHIQQAMSDFLEFLGFLNAQLYSRHLPRLESMIMPANFSSIVGEFMHTAIPRYCPTLVKNQYHNGHPDLIPVGLFPNDAAQHASEGIEIKASRFARGWQGHNPEAIWLMVFVFDSNRPGDTTKQITPRPFQFRAVFGAKLEAEDWQYSGRREGSRRTVTASVLKRGYDKMFLNWIYQSGYLIENQP